MNDLPLHPALVHLPIGIGLLAPVLALVALVRSWSGDTMRNAAWMLVVLAQAATFGGGLAAEETGEDDEHKVGEVVGEARVEEHAEAAEFFVGIAGAAFLAGAVALALRGMPARGAAALALVLSAGAAASVVRVGHSGGALVYQAGAASVHVEAAKAQATGAPRPIEPRVDHD